MHDGMYIYCIRTGWTNVCEEFLITCNHRFWSDTQIWVKGLRKCFLVKKKKIRLSIVLSCLRCGLILTCVIDDDITFLPNFLFVCVKSETFNNHTQTKTYFTQFHGDLLETSRAHCNSCYIVPKWIHDN